MIGDDFPKLNRVVIVLEGRPDGGLRIYSDDVPGLVLSGPDPAKVLSDLPTALEVLKVVRAPISQQGK
jgi:hypothetical protein